MAIEKVRKPAPVFARISSQRLRTKQFVTLQSFSVSGDVGGSRSSTLVSGERNVQNVLILLPVGQRLVLDSVRFFLINPNLRLRIRLSDAVNPDDPIFPPRIITSFRNTGEFGNRQLLFNDFSNRTLRLRLQVSVLASAKAMVSPSDGWALRLSIKK